MLRLNHGGCGFGWLVCVVVIVYSLSVIPKIYLFLQHHVSLFPGVLYAALFPPNPVLDLLFLLFHHTDEATTCRTQDKLDASFQLYFHLLLMHSQL